jgi:hypothetical protein
MLPRAVGRARAGTSADRTHDEDAAADEAAATDAGEDAEEPRYRFETPLGATAISQLSRAVDAALGRSVILERFAEGHPDEATERRLYALARGGGPFLQRALSYDRAARAAVFEAPSGTLVGEAFAAPGASAAAGLAPVAARAIGPRGAARLLKRLARAVAPLHETGCAHGALSASTVLVDEELHPAVLAAGLGPVEGDPRPADDVAALIRLVAGLLGGQPAVTSPATSAATSPAEALMAAVGNALGEAERAAVLGAGGEIATGEALYAFADALEIALLRARRPAT